MSHTSATVLIIDDEEIIREALEALLTAEGYAVVSAATAGQGLDLIGERHVDAVGNEADVQVLGLAQHALNDVIVPR